MPSLGEAKGRPFYLPLRLRRPRTKAETTALNLPAEYPLMSDPTRRAGPRPLSPGRFPYFSLGRDAARQCGHIAERAGLGFAYYNLKRDVFTEAQRQLEVRNP